MLQRLERSIFPIEVILSGGSFARSPNGQQIMISTPGAEDREITSIEARHRRFKCMSFHHDGTFALGGSFGVAIYNAEETLIHEFHPLQAREATATRNTRTLNLDRRGVYHLQFLPQGQLLITSNFLMRSFGPELGYQTMMNLSSLLTYTRDGGAISEVNMPALNDTTLIIHSIALTAHNQFAVGCNRTSNHSPIVSPQLGQFFQARTRIPGLITIYEMHEDRPLPTSSFAFLDECLYAMLFCTDGMLAVGLNTWDGVAMIKCFDPVTGQITEEHTMASTDQVLTPHALRASLDLLGRRVYSSMDDFSNYDYVLK